MSEADDLHDYCMSDQFVSETRPRPYRTGFRAQGGQSWRGAQSIADAMRLDDRAFHLWIVHCAGRDRGPQSHLSEELRALRLEVRYLRFQIEALARSLNQSTSTAPRGLDVQPR